jgi:hypothetical protein
MKLTEELTYKEYKKLLSLATKEMKLWNQFIKQLTKQYEKSKR